MASNRRKGGRARRNDELKFANSGPFAPLLDPIRPARPSRDRSGLPTFERYTPDSPESYTVETALPVDTVRLLVTAFGRDGGRRPRRRRRGGARRVAA